MLKLNNLRATESWSFTQGITYLAYNSQTVYAWVIFNLYIEKSDGRITHWEIFTRFLASCITGVNLCRWISKFAVFTDKEFLMFISLDCFLILKSY